MAAPALLRKLFVFALFAALLALASGCAEEDVTTGESEVVIPGFEDYISGKDDTGYVGTRAAELEATFTGRVRVLVPDKTPDELLALSQAVLANPGDWSHRSITAQVTEQIKYARNELKAQKLDLNLEGGAPTFTAIDVVEGGLELAYTVKVESLIKFKALEADGLTPAELVGRVVEPELPLLPTGLFERVGAACAREDGQPVDPADLGAHNLFYYFAPRAEGCPLTDADLIKAHYIVESSLDAPTVYPEYDLLGADGRVDMVALFGQITHGELKPDDWGFMAFESMTRDFERRGFQVTEDFPENRGHKLQKTYPGGLVVAIDMLTPVSFADAVPRDDANARFREAMRTHEIVYYNGHAFYGSLNVLDDRSAYPEGVYQIVFMDACWSYAYYTKQIFRNRATEADPNGYALVDVVNNTEPGITGSERTAAILWDNVFKGTAAAYVGGDASIYSWNNLVRYMNDHAEARAKLRTKYPDPEIYGASGVRDNTWKPVVPEPGAGTVVDGNRVASTRRIEIPDNDAQGITDVLDVAAGTGTTGTLAVAVDVEHTYVGDLTITLSHAGRSFELYDRQGGYQQDLHLALETDAFAGVEAAGAWSLVVVDSQGQDTGALIGWSLTFVP